jgi:hypothetical protein
MSNQRCSNCATLENEIARLQRRIEVLERQIKKLRAAIRSAVKLAYQGLVTCHHTYATAKKRLDEKNLSRTQWAYLSGVVNGAKVGVTATGQIYGFLKKISTK